MRFATTVHVDAPAADVWSVCADPLVFTRFCGEELAIRAATDDEAGSAPGTGARYRSLIRVGAATVGSDVMIVEFTPPREFAWNSITGIDHRVRIRLRPDGAGTRLELRFSYDVPGLFGSVVDLVAYPRLRRILREALKAVSRHFAGDVGNGPEP